VHPSWQAGQLLHTAGYANEPASDLSRWLHYVSPLIGVVGASTMTGDEADVLVALAAI
jgi:hypothetical protein